MVEVKAAAILVSYAVDDEEAGPGKNVARDIGIRIYIRKKKSYF